MQLPLKTRILQYGLAQDNPFTVDTVMNDLKTEYPNESMFNFNLIDEYFQSYIGIGFFKATDLKFDKEGKLIFYCVATDYARQRFRDIL